MRNYIVTVGWIASDCRVRGAKALSIKAADVRPACIDASFQCVKEHGGKWKVISVVSGLFLTVETIPEA